MSGCQDTYSERKNPVIAEKQYREDWYIIQGLAFGLMLGIMTRAAWDQGIIAAFALAFMDLGASIWVMLKDLAAACLDFFQFVIHSANS